jgi:L-rhamnose mutarotase
MNRIAFKMKLKGGFEAEYKKRHQEIWPELRSLLASAGVFDYTIFLDRETNTLFGFQKTSSISGSQDLGKELIVQKWWRYMSDIMEVNHDHSPVTVTLEEVFHMD